jgi:predicted RNase H-like HicB family nuclease
MSDSQKSEEIVSNPAVAEDGTITVTSETLRQFAFKTYDPKVIEAGKDKYPLNLYGAGEPALSVEHIGTTGKSVITHMPEDGESEGMTELGSFPTNTLPAYSYPATITEIGHMQFVVRFRDLPLIHATGIDMEEARADAIVKLNELLEDNLTDNVIFRYPSDALPNEYPIPVSEAIAVKMAAFKVLPRR